MEEAAAAEGRAQADQPALRDRQHRPHSAIEVVRHPGRLVDDQQPHAAERADGLLAPRQADDPRAVGQLRAASVRRSPPARAADGLIALDDLAKQLPRLAQRGRKQEDETARPTEGGMDGSAATVVLLPLCREQLRRTWRELANRNSRCQGSGVRPWAWSVRAGSSMTSRCVR